MTEELNFEELKETALKLTEDTLKESKERREEIENLKLIIEGLKGTKNPPPFFEKIKEGVEELLQKINKEFETLNEAEKTSLKAQEKLNPLGEQLVDRGGEITWSDNDVFTLGLQIGKMHRINKLLEIAKLETEGALSIFENQVDPSHKERKTKIAQNLKELSKNLKENAELLRMSNFKKIKYITAKLPIAKKARIEDAKNTHLQALEFTKIIKENFGKYDEVTTKKEKEAMYEVLEELKKIQKDALVIIETLEMQEEQPLDKEEIKEWTVNQIYKTAVESEKLADLMLKLEAQKKRIHSICQGTDTLKLKS